MYINEEYGSLDEDVKTLFKYFDEPPGYTVLEVGAAEENASNILAENGYKVTGIDLRPYNSNPFPCLYNHIIGDFCKMDLETFDTCFSTSAIEHFGFSYYGEDGADDNYDIIAMNKIHQILKLNGSAYITVPYGATFINEKPHWRVYDIRTLQERIIQNFQVEIKEYFLSGFCCLGRPPLVLTEEEANGFAGNPPHVTVFLKLRKV